ncbi:PREDICTED: prefoldin subunit 6-like [Branchiostoma belcheri]|uniref:Prefoldin subunit 6 n=1 Tax=Branchiostoma belcheri TaxID=7741 RepID=A0A6P4Y4Q0_BRABE|nr:PREDICTED: prefoldin subunit 6-like [Branchiostoma belcheri]
MTPVPPWTVPLFIIIITMAAMETMRNQLEKKLKEFQGVQKDLQKTASTRNQLDVQLNENKIVKEELELLETDANVYKLTGPVLVKQDLEEAKANVGKRIEYIEGEIKRQDATIKDFEEKQEKSRKELTVLQQQFQQAQAKATGKA